MRLLKRLNKYFVFLEIILIFIMPVLFLRLGVISRNLYLLVLVICTLLVTGLIFIEKISLKNLNIRIDNFKKTIFPHFILTFVGGVALIILAVILHKEKISLNLWSLFFCWSIPISFIQEFLYRGFLIYKLKKIFNSNALIILTNASLFAFMHIIYEPLVLILLLTFVPGLFLSWLSLKYPNLWLLTLSHAVLNFFAIWYTFF